MLWTLFPLGDYEFYVVIFLPVAASIGGVE